MNKGYFITLEGGEGSGKTTLLSKIVPELEAQGYEVVVTREPGGISIAEQIRAVILDTSNVTMDARTEALLYAAARRQHLVEKVIPALAQGKIVLCDRFVDSSLAYQGHARGLGMEEVMDINAFAIQSLMPDATVYLDIEPEKGMARIQSNGTREVNRLDLEALAFHHKVREGYLELLRRYPERIGLINADQLPEEVYRDTWRWLGNKLQLGVKGTDPRRRKK